MTSNFLEILNRLHDHHVDFVIVGSADVDLLVGESDGFEQLRRRAIRVSVEHRTFLVASIEDLIAMKQPAGRPQDLLDIAELRAIQDRLEEPDQ